MSGTTSPALPSLGLTPEETAELNARFERTDPAAILRWAREIIPDGRLVLSSTFGVGGMAIIHLLAEEGIKLPVVFIDTLYHFPETIEHAERVAERYGLELRMYRPAASRREFEAAHGPRLWERDEELFHRLTKVEPMKEVLEGIDGWITGRRRDQSPSRTALPHVELNGRIKINPLASWNLDLVWEFIRVHKIPYNPLHDLGYASIGDAPLTTPIKPGEHERAGRWRGSARLECGLHGI
jgi:phosphoadenosine phosphosulfate reductase